MSTHGVLAKSICITACTTALVAGATLAPAHADERPCVSQREYRDVQVLGEASPGWRQARVADHFDIPGTRIRYFSEDGYIDTVWKYRKCSAWGPGGWYVGIWYDNYSWEGDGFMRVYEKVPNRPYTLGAGFF